MAWLSLDQADNQRVSFWTYVITALQTVAPVVGAHALSLLQGPQPPPIEAVLATLLNEPSAVPNDVVLVLLVELAVGQSMSASSRTPGEPYLSRTKAFMVGSER